MAQDYVKTEWIDKETVITAEAMNKLEEQMDIITDDIIAMVEKSNEEDKEDELLSKELVAMNKRINDLEIKLYYLNDTSSAPEAIADVDYNKTSNKITLAENEILKAIKLNNLSTRKRTNKPVKWQNTVSTFFAVDENGELVGNSNPSFSTAPSTGCFSYMNNLDPSLGIQQLDYINNSISILCNFNFAEAAKIELELLQKHVPTAVKIRNVRNSINLLDENDQIIKTIKVDIYC